MTLKTGTLLKDITAGGHFNSYHIYFKMSSELGRQRIIWGAAAAFIVGPTLYLVAQQGCNPKQATTIKVIAGIWIVFELIFLYYNLR